jgi:hypothetical protein
MSETITFTAGTSTIYGSIAGARAYLGPEHAAWDVATDAEITTKMRRHLVAARRYLDRLPWGDAYLTFAARDAFTAGDGSGDAGYPFRAASYELARLADAGEVTLVASTTSEAASMTAGGSSITYRETEKQSAVDQLPDVVLDIIGAYLADVALDIATDGGVSATGGCVNPFGPYGDFDKTEGW